ncbi:SlyX family protein [Aidingimonas halophila]|nr:SlyX family protein [Aidingimonas halophila]GHC24496.1 hypothetical protein GCM10008094_14460 [Aidingimonas halophila]
MNDDTRRNDSNTPIADSLASLETRLEAVESRLAYQEHWLDELDRALAGQEKRLAALETLSGAMQERLRQHHHALQNGDTSATEPRPEDERPPHY